LFETINTEKQMRQYHLALGILALAFLSSCTKQISENAEEQNLNLLNAEESGVTTNQNAREKYVPNELLVKFTKGASANARSNALARIKGAVKEKVLTKAMQDIGDEEGFMVIHSPLSVLEAVNQLRGGGEIEFAEPNYIYTHDATSSDTYYKNGSLWGMYGDVTTPKNQYGSQAAEAWAVGHTGLKSVVVGIIDEGIQFTHPDLSNQIWTNPYDKPDGIDNDRNGYIDDIHGWDFAAGNNSIYDGGSSGAADNHGTHVAGTIGAKSNTSGVVGVNWNITIISCKFLGSKGGTTANAVKAIDYLTKLKTLHGLRIVASNNSWGGGGYSQALYDAIQRANTNNILFVAAAGNGGSDGVGDNNDVTPNYPASYSNSNIIAVAAITSSGAKASWSNYGAKTVDIGAPGSGIYSTTAYNTYSSYSGTSMATPHVTGGVALYASTHAGVSAATIKSAILSSAIPTASMNGKTVTGRRLNVGGF
jgi:subtilisin family serine protease